RRSEADRAAAHEDDPSAKKALLSMVDLYQGDYGRPFSNDWCIFRRDELCTMYLEARRQLAQIAWRGQAYDESIHHWHHILNRDNCQEEAHYHIMLCYLRQANRSAALRQYQLCKETLQEELGIEPGPAIENLHRRLRSKTE
ncbi:MAG TPA: bacterial transcriptional activator domain-containing protein, partial [Ktedonobacteraceae bacterium]|nr:bacterial transcriptional activator domain-containing protein [Ktedonobacteraceae bacterium]